MAENICTDLKIHTKHFKKTLKNPTHKWIKRSNKKQRLWLYTNQSRPLLHAHKHHWGFSFTRNRGETLQESSCPPPTRARELPAHKDWLQWFLAGPADLTATYPHRPGTITHGKLHLSTQTSNARLFQGLFLKEQSRRGKRRSFKVRNPSDTGQT